MAQVMSSFQDQIIDLDSWTRFSKRHTKITYLNVAHCYDTECSKRLVSNILPSFFNLQHLDLSHCGIISSDELCALILDLIQIKNLYLSGQEECDDQVSNTIAHHLQNLDRLDISGTQISASGIHELLVGSPNLKSVVAQQNDFTQEIPHSTHPIALKSLDLAFTSISKSFFSFLTQGHLLSLEVDIDDLAMAKQISTMSHLVKLHLRITQTVVTEEEIELMVLNLGHLPRLQHLRVIFSIEDESPPPLKYYYSLPRSTIHSPFKTNQTKQLAFSPVDSFFPSIILPSESTKSPVQSAGYFPRLVSLTYIGSLSRLPLQSFFTLQFPALEVVQSDLTTLESIQDFQHIVTRCPALSQVYAVGHVDMNLITELTRIYPKIR